MNRIKTGRQHAFVCLAVSFVVCVIALPAMAVRDSRFVGPGDFKEGYQSEQYRTKARSLQARTGEATDLFALFRRSVTGLPPPPVPEYNPPSAEAIALGRSLFYDRRLSLNNTMSCANCHVPEMGFANNELKTAIGFEGRSGRRNAPTLLNVAYRKHLFHDGRETTLENQVWSPLLAHNEMANTSVGQVIERIKVIDDYAERFQKAFGRPPSMETIGMALAQYERVLIAGNSRFDQWYYGGEKERLNEEERRGFDVFVGAGRCAACHTVGEHHALFTDNLWHNTGVGYRESMGLDEKDKERVQLAPGHFVEVDKHLIDSVSVQRTRNDIGLYEVTQDPADRWKYSTPTLRNIALTAPYMHNGSLLTLEEVVEFYDRGGVPNEVLDPLIVPLSLSAKDKKSLVAFLKTLTGASVETLVSDAFAAAPPE